MVLFMAIDKQYAGFYTYKGAGGFRIVLGYIALTLILHQEDIFVETAKRLVDVELAKTEPSTKTGD